MYVVSKILNKSLDPSLGEGRLQKGVESFMAVVCISIKRLRRGKSIKQKKLKYLYADSNFNLFTG